MGNDLVDMLVALVEGQRRTQARDPNAVMDKFLSSYEIFALRDRVFSAFAVHPAKWDGASHWGGISWS